MRIYDPRATHSGSEMEKQIFNINAILLGTFWHTLTLTEWVWCKKTAHVKCWRFKVIDHGVRLCMGHGPNWKKKLFWASLKRKKNDHRVAKLIRGSQKKIPFARIWTTPPRWLTQAFSKNGTDAILGNEFLWPPLFCMACWPSIRISYQKWKPLGGISYL